MTLLSELNRRNVFRVGAAYAVTAWLLIQIAETIFPLFGFDETPARIVVIVLAIGFVPALVLAWAFELTPEGLKREAEVDRSRPPAARTGKRLDRLIALILALALGYFAFDKFVLQPARDAALVEETVQQTRSEVLVESYGDRSIAVLPFENLSNDPDQEYFSDGVAEELLNLLAQMPRLRVISRSSSFAFRGQAVNVPDVARQLGVSHVLEGSVRRAGARVRITAQLIDARSDTHLWSHTYERQLDDIFALQDEISAAIAGELGARLAPGDGESAQARAPANSETYEAYLRGRYLMAQRSPDKLAAAVQEFSAAVALDPDYALGHAALAIALGLGGGMSELTPAQNAEQIRLHAERAMALDPELGESHAALGWALWAPATLAQAEAHFRRATELNPGYADAYMWLGHFAAYRNDYADAFLFHQRAAQLDPLSGPAQNNLFADLLAQNRLDDAARQLDKMASLYPNERLWWQAQLRSAGGNWADGALAYLEDMAADNLYAYGDLRILLALMGMESEALADPAALGMDEDTAAQFAESSIDVLALLGRQAEALSTWEQGPRPVPQEPGPGFLPFGVLLAAAGESSRAAPILEQAWSVFDHIAGIGGPSRDANFVLALLSARHAQGNEAGDSKLKLALREAVRRYGEAGLTTCDVFIGCVDFDAGISAYLDGDRERGLLLIARSIEAGYLIPPNISYLQFLYDDAGFAAIRQQQAERQTRERRKFLAVVCTDNPYADSWQPSEESCAEIR